jgi:hypothetical protein
VYTDRREMRSFTTDDAPGKYLAGWGAAMACDEVFRHRCRRRGNLTVHTERRTDTRVLFETEDRVSVVMKFPRAKLESVAGIAR